MSTQRPGRRARANTAGDYHVSSTGNKVPAASPRNGSASDPKTPPNLEKNLELLPDNTIKELLKQAAIKHPDVNAQIEATVEDLREKQRNRVISFHSRSRNVWHEINDTKRYSYWGQEEMALDVFQSVESTIQRIGKEASENDNPETHKNGLSVLRKIGKTICLSTNSTLGREVQEHFSLVNHSLENAMMDIISAMTPSERRAVRQDDSDFECLWPKLVELEHLAQDQCVFDRMADVLTFLDGGAEPVYSDDDEEGD